MEEFNNLTILLHSANYEIYKRKLTFIPKDFKGTYEDCPKLSKESISMIKSIFYIKRIKLVKCRGENATFRLNLNRWDAERLTTNLLNQENFQLSNLAPPSGYTPHWYQKLLDAQAEK